MMRHLYLALLGISLLTLVAGCPPDAPPKVQDSQVGAFPQTVPTTELIKPAPTTRDTSSVTIKQGDDAAPAQDDWRAQSIITYLASDALEGRGVGTRGLDIAADFLASRLREAGVRPLPGMSGYFQDFDYAAARAASPDCALALGQTPLKLHEDYVPLSFSGEGSFTGQVVSVGFGITDTEKGYDDYARVDVRGKVALAQRFEPMDPTGKSLLSPAGGADWSNDAQLETKAANAAAHGAVALLLVTPPQLLQADDPLIPFTRFYKGKSALIPVLNVKANVANSLASTNAIATGNVAIQQTTAHLKNVIGFIPGIGASASQMVVVGAHYDHLGRGQLLGQAGSSGSIFHGADDNASGVTAVLELARMASSNRPRLRGIVFCFFSAEEEGLIGSDYFVNNPPVPLDHVVAMLNLDMVGRIRNQTMYVGGQGTAQGLDAVVSAAAQGQPLQIKPMEADGGGRGGLGPTDQMSFALKHIPVLCLFSGLHPDYHRPTDTAGKINFAGIDEVAAFCSKLLDGLSTMGIEPYDTSADMARFSMMKDPANDIVFGASLGVIPDYSAGASQAGVLIEGVRPDSPADHAGMQAGDLIVKFGTAPLQSLDQLSLLLARARGGDVVQIQVLRQNKSLDLTATLATRKD